MAIGKRLKKLNRRAGNESTQRTASEIGKKALLALVGGALTFFLTSLSGGPREWSVMFSCFVGSVILIGEFLYGVERRIDAMETALETHHQKISKLVERRFSEIANVTELFSLVESSPVQSETVRQFLRHAVSLDPSSRLLLDFAHSEISRVSQVLGDLQHGTATYFGEDQDWLLELTRSAQVSIEATSLPTVDAALWNSPLGRRYLLLQKEAVERGVKVRRIFVVLDPDVASNEAFLAMCQYHVELHIEVRILRPESVPRTMENSIVDFILFDRTISYETDTAINSTGKSRRPAIIRTRLTMPPNETVTKHIDDFEKLWNAAETFPEDPVAAAEKRTRRPTLPGRRR